MRDIHYEPTVLRDLKRLSRQGKSQKKFLLVIEVLADKGTVPPALRPHKLHGVYGGLWECHIEFDWLLVYNVTPEQVIVYRTGSHDDLF